MAGYKTGAVHLRSATFLGLSNFNGALYNLAVLANKIVALSSRWSVTTAATDMTLAGNKAITILTHTSGAQMALVAGTAAPLNVGNNYAGAAAIAGYVYLAFKPSTHGPAYALNPGVNDPFTTAAWCDNYDSYKFTRVAASSIYGGDLVSYLSVHDTYAHVTVAFTGVGSSSSDVDSLCIAVDDAAAAFNYMALQTVGDLETSLLLGFPTTASQLINDTGKECQLFTSAGVRTEEADPLSYRSDDLSIAYQSDPEAGFDVERILVATTTTGRKGILDHRIACGINKQAAYNLLLNGGAHIHFSRGLVIGWDPTFGQILY